MRVKHVFRSVKPDPADASLIKPSNWNDIHVIDDGVKGLGAVGDGVTDDTAAIQAALDSRDIFFPPGTYLTNRINIPSNRRIFCEYGQVTIKPIGTILDDAFWTILNKTRVEVSGLHFDIPVATHPNLIALYCGTSSFIYAHDILIDDAARMGVITLGCADSTFERIRVVAPTEMGISHQASGARIKTIDCRVLNPGISHGIQYKECSDAEVRGCYVLGGEIFGINIWRTARGIVESNTLEDCIKEGINLDGSSFIKVVDNSVFWTASASEDFGISVYGATSLAEFANHNIIANNTIAKAGKSAITLAESAQHNVVSGNTIFDPNMLAEAHGAGILLYGSTCIRNQVATNNIHCGTTGRYGVNEHNDGVSGEPSDNTISGNFIYTPVTAPVKRFATTRESLNRRDHETYTPSVVSSVGTLTTVAAEGDFYQTEKNVHFHAKVTITNAGSGAGTLSVSLPFTAARNAVCSAMEIVLTGVTGSGSILASGTSVGVLKWDGTTIIGTGNVIDISGTFERA